MPVGAGFTPANKHQKNSLFELERGRKVRAYDRIQPRCARYVNALKKERNMLARQFIHIVKDRA